MDKCLQCGHAMEPMEGMYTYDESGLRNVILMNIPMYRCSNCGEKEVEIPYGEELHLLLGLLVIYKPTSLGPEEVRFLRKNMGYIQEELASYLGVKRGTVTRWESSRSISRDQDKALRQLYLRKKSDELESLGISAQRLLETVLEELPMEKKRTYRLRTEDWMRKRDKDDRQASLFS